MHLPLPLDALLPIVHFHDIRSNAMHHPPFTCQVACISDELVDEHILVGAILLVNRALCPRHGQIVVAVVEGQIRIRRFRKIQHHISLWAPPVIKAAAVLMDPVAGAKLVGPLDRQRTIYGINYLENLKMSRHVY